VDLGLKLEFLSLPFVDRVQKEKPHVHTHNHPSLSMQKVADNHQWIAMKKRNMRKEKEIAA